MKETWRPIPGIPGYEASDRGRVRSWVKRQGVRRDRPLLRKPVENKQRGCYQLMNFSTPRGVVRRYVHHVVLRAFGKPGRRGQEVRHLDGNNRNNRLDNLKWGTHRVNMRDQVAHGTHTKGHRNGNAKLTPRQVAAIRRSPATGRSLAEEYGVHPSTIARVKTGQRYV
jgi:hypothetical protein